jgi:hypothetical protein
MPDMPFVLITVQSASKKPSSLQFSKALSGMTWIPTRTTFLEDAYTVVISVLSVRISEGGGSFYNTHCRSDLKKTCTYLCKKKKICNQDETLLP